MKKWASLNEFLSAGRVGLTWLILRNFEEIPDQISCFSDDIDILCNRLDLCVEVLGLEKRAWGVSSYFACVGGVKVPVDVRFVGDGYFEKSWEKDILSSAIEHRKGFMIPSPRQHFFSYLYHILVHKPHINEQQLKNLELLRRKVDVGECNVEDHQSLMALLVRYMNEELYVYELPIDSCIPLNKDNTDWIVRMIEKIPIEAIPFKISIARRLPKSVVIVISFFKRLIFRW